jgi:uncharacterized alpha-E superfamily protein
MLSRVAENLYWMARYVERAENTARLINVNTNLLLDLPRKIRFGWEPLIEITGGESIFRELYEEPGERQVMRFFMGDERNPGSIVSSLRSARENARTVRDIIPREAWEQINDLYLNTKANAQGGISQNRRYDFLKSIILGTQQITGLLAGTMSHDFGYDFIRLGRNLERADMTTRIIDVRSADLLPERDESLKPFDNIQWMSVLKSLTAYQMYRRQVQQPVRRPLVLHFLLQDRQFPRAFYHCLGEVEGCLLDLPRHDAPLRVVNRLQRMVTEASPHDLVQQELHEFIDNLQLGLAELHAVIRETYYAAMVAAPRAEGGAEDAAQSQRQVS